jgi:hypothetical protein
MKRLLGRDLAGFANACGLKEPRPQLSGRDRI